MIIVQSYNEAHVVKTRFCGLGPFSDLDPWAAGWKPGFCDDFDRSEGAGSFEVSELTGYGRRKARESAVCLERI